MPAGGGASVAKVTGTVTYRERIALPPTAVIKVQLVDVSRADAPAIVLGEQVTHAAGKQVPFAFEIPFDPARIEASHSYAVQARIEQDGQAALHQRPALRRHHPWRAHSRGHRAPVGWHTRAD